MQSLFSCCTQLSNYLRRAESFLRSLQFLSYPIKVLVRARHLSLSSVKQVQSMPYHPTPLRSILTVPSHLRLDLPSGLFLFRFPIKTLQACLFVHICATFLLRCRQNSTIKFGTFKTVCQAGLVSVLAHKFFVRHVVSTNCNTFNITRMGWSPMA
jgi:hypothetical protein